MLTFLGGRKDHEKMQTEANEQKAKKSMTLRSSQLRKINSSTGSTPKCHFCRAKFKPSSGICCKNYQECHGVFCLACLKTTFKDEFKTMPLLKEDFQWVCVICRSKCECSRCKKRIDKELEMLHKDKNDPMAEYSEEEIVVVKWRRKPLLKNEAEFHGPKDYNEEDQIDESSRKYSHEGNLSAGGNANISNEEKKRQQKKSKPKKKEKTSIKSECGNGQKKGQKKESIESKDKNGSLKDGKKRSVKEGAYLSARNPASATAKESYPMGPFNPYIEPGQKASAPYHYGGLYGTGPYNPFEFFYPNQNRDGAYPTPNFGQFYSNPMGMGGLAQPYYIVNPDAYFSGQYPFGGQFPANSGKATGRGNASKANKNESSEKKEEKDGKKSKSQAEVKNKTEDKPGEIGPTNLEKNMQVVSYQDVPSPSLNDSKPGPPQPMACSSQFTSPLLQIASPQPLVPKTPQTIPTSDAKSPLEKESDLPKALPSDANITKDLPNPLGETQKDTAKDQKDANASKEVKVEPIVQQ